MERTVATYNVRQATLDSGRHAWPRRKEGVVKSIRRIDPDIVGLQESTGDQQRAIERALSAFSWHGAARAPGSDTPIGVGERWHVEDVTVSWLSETPAVAGSVGWDAAEPRTATRVDCRAGGSVALAVFNTHFDHQGRRAREESARWLRERIDALPSESDAVVLGDLNCRSGSTPYRILTGGGFDRSLGAAREQAGTVSGPETTVTDFRSLERGQDRDHIFVTKGVTVERYAVHDRTVGGRYPSDHLPVSAALQL